MSLARAMTPYSVLAEAKLTRAARPGASILLVEGSDDARFWRRHSILGTEIVTTGGHMTATSALALIRTDRDFANPPHHGCLVSIDRDYRPPTSDLDTIETDFHSLEVVLLASPALEVVLREFGNTKKIARHSAAEQSVFESLVRRCVVLGAIRWYCAAMHVDFASLRLSVRRLLSCSDWTLNESELWQIAGAGGVSEASVRSFLTASPRESRTEIQICHGHDMMDCLSVGLSSHLGDAPVSAEQLTSSLRLAFVALDFAATNMYAATRAWERRAQPFRILP